MKSFPLHPKDINSIWRGAWSRLSSHTLPGCISKLNSGRTQCSTIFWRISKKFSFGMKHWLWHIQTSNKSTDFMSEKKGCKYVCVSKCLLWLHNLQYTCNLRVCVCVCLHDIFVCTAFACLCEIWRALRGLSGVSRWEEKSDWVAV